LGLYTQNASQGKTVFYFGKRNLILALDKRENNDYGIIYWPDGQTSFRRMYSSTPLKNPYQLFPYLRKLAKPATIKTRLFPMLMRKIHAYQ
jgi:hypothetical protein